MLSKLLIYFLKIWIESESRGGHLGSRAIMQGPLETICFPFSFFLYLTNIPNFFFFGIRIKETVDSCKLYVYSDTSDQLYNKTRTNCQINSMVFL